MDQDLANKKIKEWGALLLLNSPKDINFGIDNTIWKTGAKFKGVKLIPPGSHYVHYSLSDENHQFKLGFFLNVSPAKVYYPEGSERIFIKQWSTECQDFLLIDQVEEERYIQSVENFEFDQYLGTYPLEKLETWKEVSYLIDDRVLKKLDPIEKRVYLIDEEYQNKQVTEKQKRQEIINQMYGENEEKAFPEDECEEENQINENEKKNEKSDKEKFSVIGGTIYYTEIPQRKVLHGVSGEALTKMNFDKSLILKDLLKMVFDNDHKLLLGEFQYAFIVFLLGENLESFEQWKKIFILITSCDQLTSERTDVFIDLIPCLYAMLKQLPPDFFTETITANNFMEKCLQNFMEIGVNHENKILRGRCVKLSEMLFKNFNFSTRALKEEYIPYDPNDEDAPVIVENPNDFY